jgi:hypothetical protein
MNTAIRLALLVLVLAACTRGTDTPPAATATTPAPAADTPRAAAAAPAVAQAPAPPPAAVPVAETFTLRFTAKDEAAAEHDPRIVRWEDGPCGATPVAKVTRIPLDDAVLLPDAVVEFDAAGKELRRWGRPYEASVIGLDGDRLLFRADDDTAFWTDDAGTLGRSDAAGDDLAAGAPALDCPTLPSFAGSDYLQCFDVTDRAGRHRRLAWEGPCT